MRVHVLATIAASWLASALLPGCGSPIGVPDGRAATSGPASVPSRSDATLPAHGRAILVDIPAFNLIALEDGRPVLRSRVIVGRPETPTPELSSSLYAVTFNPSWTPTPAMVRQEGARPLPPGPRNPLGRILFELDNDELVFLHDTNDRSLFDRADRALSHGCVRVERAHALAAWALQTSDDEIARLIASGATRTIPLPAAIPVLLTYHAPVAAGDDRVGTPPEVSPQTQREHERPGRPQQAARAGCAAPP